MTSAINSIFAAFSPKYRSMPLKERSGPRFSGDFIFARHWDRDRCLFRHSYDSWFEAESMLRHSRSMILWFEIQCVNHGIWMKGVIRCMFLNRFASYHLDSSHNNRTIWLLWTQIQIRIKDSESFHGRQFLFVCEIRPRNQWVENWYRFSKCEQGKLHPSLASAVCSSGSVLPFTGRWSANWGQFASLLNWLSGKMLWPQLSSIPIFRGEMLHGGKLSSSMLVR